MQHDPKMEILQWRNEKIRQLEEAHRQLQATIDRLGNDNAKLRAALERIFKNGPENGGGYAYGVAFSALDINEQLTK